MTNTFFNEAKTLVSLFIEETRESTIWFAAELKRQYHLSILKEIASTYPETQIHIDKACEIVDGIPQDCPDFVEAPEDSFELPDIYERTDIESDFKVENDHEEEGDHEKYNAKFAAVLQSLKGHRKANNEPNT